MVCLCKHRGKAELELQTIRNFGVRRRWMISNRLRPLYPGKEAVPTLKEAGWTQGPVWTTWKMSLPFGILSQDCPAVSESTLN